MLRHMVAAACLALAAGPAAAHDLSAGQARTELVFDQPLPNLPGKSLRAVMVDYGAGGASPSHTHAPSAYILATVIEGAVRSQINGGPVQVFTEGQSFIEMPGDHHQVSANASETEASKLIAVFIVDTAETELTIPDPE